MTFWIIFGALPLLVLGITLANLMTWRRGSRSFAPTGSVTVLIPARNEERTIGKALESVLASEDAHLIDQIIVYDDKSVDATRRIVKRAMSVDDRVHLLSGGPLPEGWIGKPHACANLADAATGDFLLFMDADVSLKPTGLRRLLSLAQSKPRGRVVTAVPQQLAETLFEKLIIPLLTLTYTSWLPLRAVEWGRDAKTVAANGQLLLVDRDAYDGLGGFDAVRNEIVDDVAFCKRAKSAGYKVVFADGSDMAHCRMYRGTAETIDGFSKNLHEGVGGSLGLLLVCLLYFGAFLAPFVALVPALLVPGFEGWLAPTLAGVTAILMVRVALVLRFAQSWLGVVLHPVSIAAFLYIALNSWRWQRAGKIHWAGRTYAPRKDRTEKERASTISPVRGLSGGVS